MFFIIVFPQDLLEYKSKQRILKVRTLDGAIRKMQVDDSHTVGQLLITITSRIGMSHHSSLSHMQPEEAGLPRSGKNIWKIKFFPGQGKVREFCEWSGKFRKDLESQGKVREFRNKWLRQADFRKFI